MDNASTVQSAEFGELEAYSEALEHADFRVTATDRPERPHWSVRTLDLPGGVQIQCGSEGCANILEGATNDEGIVLWALANNAPTKCNGTEFGPQSLFIMPANAEISFSCDAGQDWLDVFIPNDLVSAMVGYDTMLETTKLGARVAEISATDLVKLRSLTDGLFENAAREPRVTSAPAALASFSETLLAVVARQLKATGNAAQREEGRPSTIDAKLMRYLVDRIEAELTEPVTLTELVSMTRLSERTLRNAFNKYFGVSPQRYIQLRRLYRAHSLLRKAKSDEVNVTQVAAELGMWDLGRFAMKYRALFGERPSETLRH